MPRQRTYRLIVTSMRPKQWLKNAFVLTGLVFSGRALEIETAARAFGAFAAFCAVSGAMYLLNDVADAESDRLNPRTAHRPIARGALSRAKATVAAVIIGLAGLGLGALIDLETLGVLAAFVALQVAYTNVLKHVMIVDVMAIAAGFVLRALAGIFAIDSPLSPWLLLEAGLLALFLGLGKRRGEIVAAGGTGPVRRKVLEGYTVALVDELIAVVTPAILMVYAIYCVLGASSQAMLLTLPFVLYGIFRVLVLMQHTPEATEDPTLIAWRDKPLVICMGLWAVLAGAITVTTI